MNYNIPKDSALISYKNNIMISGGQ